MGVNEIGEAMKEISHGVYIIGAHEGEKYNLMTAAWLCQVSGNPPTVMVAIAKKHYTSQMLKESKKFAVSALTTEQKEIAAKCGTVSGRDKDKMEMAPVEFADEGLPFIQGAAAYLTCKVTDVFENSDHYLFLGEVVWGQRFSGELMLYGR